MDRHQRRSLTELFATSDRDFEAARAKTDLWSEPWGMEPAEEAATPASTYDGRGVYLRWRSGGSAPVGAKTFPRLTIRFRARPSAESRSPFGRRIVAGLGIVSVGGALLIGVPRYDFAPAIKTVSGTTNTAVERLTSVVSTALDLVGKGPVAPVATKDVVAISTKSVPRVRPRSAERGPISSSRALELTPLINAETVQSNGPGPSGDAADTVATPGTRSGEAVPFPKNVSAIDASIIYSPSDTDVSAPVAIRSPGIATYRGPRDRSVALIEILVGETGLVESARGRQRPATLGALLQSSTALGAVKTWRFRPAHRNGHPVKYRTTVMFAETANSTGTIDRTR